MVDVLVIIRNDPPQLAFIVYLRSGRVKRFSEKVETLEKFQNNEPRSERCSFYFAKSKTSFPVAIGGNTCKLADEWPRILLPLESSKVTFLIMSQPTVKGLTVRKIIVISENASHWKVRPQKIWSSSGYWDISIKRCKQWNGTKNQD